MRSTTIGERLRDVVQAHRSTRPDSLLSLPAPPTAHGGPSRSLEEIPGGVWRDGPLGRSFVVLRRVRAQETHGRDSVGQFARCLEHAAAAAQMCGAPQARAPFLFFDLETTGLSGGAGTYAFLVGCAWFDAQGEFVTEQHLLADYAGERSMLSAVAEEVARAGALVTFNGKSFDAPVVETRYLYHRRESPCALLPHVDVLHPARRFWGGTSDAGCTLATLESRVLGVRRHEDVPGVEIPERYFQFVRSGDAAPLMDVFEHNRLDLLSLAGLTARIFHLVSAGPEATEDAHEALALGRLYERGGHAVRSEAAFERALALTEAVGGKPSVQIEALRALALEARRSKRYGPAAERWAQLLEAPMCPPHVAREATEALAIHHEHRARNLSAARVFALRGLELDLQAARGDASRHRLARLERKLVSERALLLSSSSPRSTSQPSFGFRTSGRRTSS